MRRWWRCSYIVDIGVSSDGVDCSHHTHYDVAVVDTVSDESDVRRLVCFAAKTIL